MKTILAILLTSFMGLINVQAQSDFMTKEFWLEDDLTIPFSKEPKGSSFNGIRFLFEPQFGYVMPWGTNRLEIENITQIPRLGVETNLKESWIALQLSYLAPTSVTFDSQSSIVSQRVIPGDRKVKLDAGVAAGFSFLNGVVVVGLGYLNYDQRDFNTANPEFNTDQTSDVFGYVNLQPVSIVRAFVRKIKPE